MCGFIAVHSRKKEIVDGFERNSKSLMRLIGRRGPDARSDFRSENLFVSHALLAINDHVEQPVHNDRFLVFMNGEIYNDEALNSRNDAEWLLSFFDNEENPSTLDGEFIICSLDKERNELTVISDPFATKPCFFSYADDFIAVSSYSEPLVEAFENSVPVFEFPPNGVLKFDLSNYKILSFHENIEWDFNPRKNDFQDWNEAFSNSVRKRAKTDKGIFLGLSSGYDSGLIVSELLSQEISFDSYSIMGSENVKTLEDRMTIVNESNFSNANLVRYDKRRYDLHFQFIQRNSSNYPYTDVYGRLYEWMLRDKAAVGLSMICEDAKKTGAKIYLSGQGADEIFSDYSTQEPLHGTIRGNYSGVREKWVNFDRGFQRNFLSKEERIPGAWGIEARYPFLDRFVVQEFLWLNDELKNCEYKQCLAQRLRMNNFPFVKNEKCGFNPLKNLEV